MSNSQPKPKLKISPTGNVFFRVIISQITRELVSTPFSEHHLKDWHFPGKELHTPDFCDT